MTVVPLLDARGVTVRFGGVLANDDVTVAVPPGGFVGLIGPNGAGKTTLIDALTGFVPLDDGDVLVDGISLNGLSPSQRARRGLLRTFQSLELFDDLTVEQNCYAAAEEPRRRDLILDMVKPRRQSRATDQVEWAMSVVGVEGLRHERPLDLSHGTRKLVALARVLAARPRLVLLDEPAAGLDTTESRELGRRLGLLIDEGISVLMIDHDMGLVFAVCDSIYVLDFGHVIAHGTPDEIRRDPAVVSAYLGRAGGS